MDKYRSTYSLHFIYWHLEEILAAVDRNPMRVFEVVKVDFHDPLKSVVYQYCE